IARWTARVRIVLREHRYVSGVHHHGGNFEPGDLRTRLPSHSSGPAHAVGVRVLATVGCVHSSGASINNGAFGPSYCPRGTQQRSWIWKQVVEKFGRPH